MSNRSLRQQLERLEAALPPLPIPLEELPVEQWVGEQMQNALSETTLKNTTDEEHFYKVLAELPKHLIGSLYFEFGITASPIPLELFVRVLDTLPPHIERLRRLWADNYPARERRRQWMTKMGWPYPKVKTRDNGYGWWFRAQEEYSRLAREYSDFDTQWPRFYEEWANSPMDDAMRVRFIRICFCGDFSSATLSEEPEGGA
jgi:hypothetical protein